MARPLLQLLEEVRVLTKVASLIRFWELRSRRECLGMPLDDVEQAEVLELLERLGGDHASPRLLGDDVFDAAVPSIAEAGCVSNDGDRRACIVTLACSDGRLMAATLWRVGAGGVVVRSERAEPLRAGARVTVHAIDAVAGVEYVVPCRVAWMHDEPPHEWVGLVVDGVPSRTSFEGSSVGDGLRPAPVSPRSRADFEPRSPRWRPASDRRP